MKKIYILFFVLCVSVLLFSCAEPAQANVDHTDDAFIAVSMDVDDAYRIISESNIQAYSLGNVVGDAESDSYISGELSVPWVTPATADLHQDATAPESYTITFEGKEYTGTYSYSLYPIGSDQIQHTYIVNDKINFSINGKTQEFVQFYSVYALGSPTLSQQECFDIINSKIVNYINPDDYQLTITDSQKICTFRYVKYHRMIKTSEYVNIVMSKDTGNIVVFASNMLGRFPAENNLSANNSVQAVNDDYLTLATAKALTLSPQYTVLDSVGEPFWGMVDGKMMLFYSASLYTEEERLSGHVSGKTFYIALDTEGNLVTE